MTSVACLAGDGVGPELMAEAARVLARVSKLHSLGLEDIHLPFAGEAVTRSGHPLPAGTRAGYRASDAVLVAAPHEPALEGVKADLELAVRVSRIDAGDGVLVVGALGEWADGLAIERAFSSAAARHGRVTSVGSSPAWRGRVDAERARWGGMLVEHLSFGETLLRLRESPHAIDVVVADSHTAPAVVDAVAHLSGAVATVAHGWLAEGGPGLFAPGACDASEVAGLGVADPTAMLLTTSLMLAEGLERRSAATTLERAVGAVTRLNGSAPRGTRPFADAVIARLAEERTDVELYAEEAA
jgi:3-isopropylmalate dehydrogenase